MNAKKKNELLSKLNEFLSPVASAEMRDGKVSIKNTRPGRSDGAAEWFQANIMNLDAEIASGFEDRDDAGNGIWQIGEGFRAARVGDLGNCSDPYCSTTEEVREHLSR